MSLPDPRRAALALRDASEALRASLGGDDDAAIGRALELREAGLRGLADALEGRSELAEDVVAVVSDARRRDAEALALAERRLREVRGELDQVRRAREVARSLSAPGEPARFVDKRV